MKDQEIKAAIEGSIRGVEVLGFRVKSRRVNCTIVSTSIFSTAITLDELNDLHRRLLALGLPVDSIEVHPGDAGDDLDLSVHLG